MSEFYAIALLFGLVLVYFILMNKLHNLDNLSVSLASDLNAQATRIDELTDKLKEIEQKTTQHQPFTGGILNNLTLIHDKPTHTYLVRFEGGERVHDAPIADPHTFRSPDELRQELEKIALQLRFTKYHEPIDEFVHNMMVLNILDMGNIYV